MRRDRQRLYDILEALDWIAKAIAGRMEADFLSDDTLCYALAQKLTIIGEAVARMVTVLSAILRPLTLPASTARFISSVAARLPSRLSHQFASCSVVRNCGMGMGLASTFSWSSSPSEPRQLSWRSQSARILLAFSLALSHQPSRQA